MPFASAFPSMLLNFFSSRAKAQPRKTAVKMKDQEEDPQDHTECGIYPNRLEELGDRTVGEHDLYLSFLTCCRGAWRLGNRPV